MNGWVRALSRRVEAGVLLVDESGAVQLVSDGAATLLGRTPDEVRAGWPHLRDRLQAQAGDDLWRQDESELDVELDVGSPEVGSQEVGLQEVGSPEVGSPGMTRAAGGRRRFRAEVLRVEEDDCRGHLILLREGRRVETAERDLGLISLMRSVGHLYRSMAHDLRAPLNAMVVNLELLSDSVATGGDGDLDQRRRRYVAVLKEEMERLHRLLETFLSQTAPPAAQRRRFDLAEHLHRMIRFVAPQAQRQGVELILDLPQGAVEVEGNPDHLRQAVLSLLVNALEAVEGREGGRVEMGLADGGEVGTPIRLWVADDGPGVDAPARDRVFQMHYTTKPAGSGIGLSVAHRIAAQHGGSLRLESSDTYGGAHFEITLPRPPAAADEES